MDSSEMRLLVNRIIQTKLALPSAYQYMLLIKHTDEKNLKYLLQEALQHHPFNKEILNLLKSREEKTYLLRKSVKKILGKKANTHFFYKNCVIYLLQHDEKKHAKEVALIGLQHNSLNEGYLRFVAKQAMAYYDWKLAQKILKKLCTLHKTARSYYDYGVCLQILGNHSEAIALFEKAKELDAIGYKNLFNDGYRMYTIFDNGLSRIELYKHEIITKKVMATFDTIDLTWHQKPFSFNLMKKKSMDLVSLRRDHTRNFHQDMSREAYIHCTGPLFSTYEESFAYGTSLGGYGALYFGSLIPNVHILSMAPRNSAHPDYGARTIKVKEPFQHISPHPISYNGQITIVYDSRNDIDRKYIEQEVLPSYPNAHIVKIDYAGHRVARFLQQTKQLKSVMEAFLSKSKIPTIKRGDLRRQSTEYYWVMSEYCLQFKHYSWTIAFAEQGIRMDEQFYRPYLTKLKALTALKRMDEALEFAEMAYRQFPQEPRVVLLLARTYREIGDVQSAIQVLEEFSTNKQVASVKKLLYKLRKEGEALSV